jgi:hypothetical protein
MAISLAAAMSPSSRADTMWHIASGGCHDEQSGEEMAIENYTFSHYGIFAVGHSTSGVDMRVAEYDNDQILLALSTGETEVRSYVMKSKRTPTAIVLSLRISNPGQANDHHWFSCDLKVQR